MTTFKGPATQASGVAGTLTIGSLKAGVLTNWRMVVSPKSTPERLQFVLFADGRLARFYAEAIGQRATADVTPAPAPTRIGRKKPPTPRPFRLTGVIVEINARHIVLAEGEIQAYG